MPYDPFDFFTPRQRWREGRGPLPVPPADEAVAQQQQPLSPAAPQPGNSGGGYQNPGAGLLPGFAPIGTPIPGLADDPSLPPPGFPSPGGAPTGPTTIQPGQLNALVRGGSAPRGPLFGGAGPQPAAPPAQGIPMPRIFNEGVEQQNDAALPVSMFPNGPPPGYRRVLEATTRPGDAPRYSAADASGSIFSAPAAVPSARPGDYYQRILPGETLPDGSDARRQGTSLPELQAANPAWSNARIAEQLQRLQAQTARGGVNTLGLQQDARNMGQGLFTDAQREGVSRFGMDPRTGGGTVNRALDNETRRITLDEWNHSPDGRRFIAEQRAQDAYNAQPPGPGRRTVQDFIRDMAAFEAGGMLGAPTNHAAAGGGLPATTSGGHPPQSVTPVSSIPVGVRPPATARYNAELIQAGAAGNRSYESHQGELDRVFASLPPAEATPGAFIDRLNRDNPAFVVNNFAALRDYLRDKFGATAYRDAATSGVRHNPYTNTYFTGATMGNGIGAGLGRWLGNLATGMSGGLFSPPEMTGDQSGRAMLMEYLARHPELK